MARKHSFEKTKYKGIYSLKQADGSTHYYANFMLEGVSYQKKNLTKLFNSTTEKQASDQLEELKADIRRGKNPFNLSSHRDKIKDIVIELINSKKPEGESTAYKKSLEGFYYNYVDPVIGHLKIEKVRDAHVDKIMKSLSKYRKEYQQNLQTLMYKIFEKEFRRGNIPHNPFYGLDYADHWTVPGFDIRLNEAVESAAKKLYRTVLSFNEKYRLLFIITIMLARRVGETHKLTYGHIKRDSEGEWYVLATSEITKTNVNEKYPLPAEAIELLPDDILDNEKSDKRLFNFSESGIPLNWTKLVEEAKIQINEGYKLTSHDCRKMFISILSGGGKDSDLVDSCLSHSKSGMKHTYMDIGYQIKKEIF